MFMWLFAAAIYIWSSHHKQFFTCMMIGSFTTTSSYSRLVFATTMITGVTFLKIFWILPILYNKYIIAIIHFNVNIVTIIVIIKKKMTITTDNHNWWLQLTITTDLHGQSIRTQCTRSGGTRSVVGCYMGSWGHCRNGHHGCQRHHCRHFHHGLSHHFG